MILYYCVCFGIGFIIDKIKNKVLSFIFIKTSKQLLLCYTKDWHREQRLSVLELMEWILV